MYHSSPATVYSVYDDAIGKLPFPILKGLYVHTTHCPSNFQDLQLYIQLHISCVVV